MPRTIDLIQQQAIGLFLSEPVAFPSCPSFASLNSIISQQSNTLFVSLLAAIFVNQSLRITYTWGTILFNLTISTSGRKTEVNRITITELDRLRRRQRPKLCHINPVLEQGHHHKNKTLLIFYLASYFQTVI